MMRNAAECRIEIERKRFKLEKEERTLAVKERKKMLGLIEALSKKLQ